MIHRLFPVVASFACLLSAACYPVGEGPSRPQQPYVKVSPPTASIVANHSHPDQPMLVEPKIGSNSVGRNEETAPALRKEDTVVTAAKAVDKEGYVISPYSGKLILVRDIPSGVVLPDQTVPTSETKFFRVP